MLFCCYLCCTVVIVLYCCYCVVLLLFVLFCCYCVVLLLLCCSVVIVLYCCYCVVLLLLCCTVVICVVLLFALFYVLFVCKCVLYHCHQVFTQLQLTNISYIIYHIISYHIHFVGICEVGRTALTLSAHHEPTRSSRPSVLSLGCRVAHRLNSSCS